MANNIIITGANQGIGYFMAEKLLAEGNRVLILDIETDNLSNLKKQYWMMMLQNFCLTQTQHIKTI